MARVRTRSRTARVSFVRHPNGRQFVRPQQPCQRLCVPPIGFHPVAWPARGSATAPPQCSSVQEQESDDVAIPGRSGLVAGSAPSRNAQPACAPVWPRHRACCQTRRDSAVPPSRPPSATATAFRAFAVSIPTNASPCLLMARPLCVEARPGQSGQPSLNPAYVGRATSAAQRTCGLMLQIWAVR